MLVVPRGVQDSGYFYDITHLIDFIDDTIRKAIQVAPSNFLGRMTATAEKWIVRQGLPCPNNFHNELRTKPRLTCFIPIGCYGYILFYLSGANSNRQLICCSANGGGTSFLPTTRRMLDFLVERRAGNPPAHHQFRPKVDHPVPERGGQVIGAAQS